METTHEKAKRKAVYVVPIKLGSLFDGIGVFPLAASRNGIIPVWASEIEKSPIAITKRHFPDMEHLGDITKIHGGNISPVHIITFGSPCQNLSKIGKREGLAGMQIRTVFSGYQNYRRNEVCYKWVISSYRCLGKRHGSVFYK